MNDKEKNILDLVGKDAKARARTEAATRLMVKDVAEQFNLIHQSDAHKFDTMAAQLNRLGVMIEVIIDLMINPKPLEAEGLAVNKRDKFNALCAHKEAALTTIK